MDVVITSSSWARFLALVAEWSNQGEWGFEKALRAFAESEGWDWMPLGDKREFRHWASVILRVRSRLAYAEGRRAQLLAASFDFWVFKRGSALGCPSEHDDLDGIVLPRDHDFWTKYSPPIGWECSCYVAGARTLSMARRLGGDPDKELPDWWRDGRGIEEGFGGNDLPDLLKVIELLGNGYFD